MSTSRELCFTCVRRRAEVQLDRGELPDLRGEAGPGVAFRGYRRCREYDPKDGEGQDEVVLFTDRQRVIAVLADGVSQSFYGQLAAEVVVRGLGDYLRSG